jgi:hypothetical protein
LRCDHGHEWLLDRLGSLCVILRGWQCDPHHVSTGFGVGGVTRACGAIMPDLSRLR